MSRPSPRRLAPALRARTRVATLAALALLAPAVLSAQRPAKRAQGATGADAAGGFLQRLGTDTLSLERYQRTADRLEGDLLVRSPRTRLYHYTATLGPGGTVTRIEIAARTLVPAAGSPGRSSSTIAVAGDTARVELHLGDSTRAMAVAGAAGGGPLVPMVPFTFAMYEQMFRQTVAAGRDSMAAQLVFPGAPQPTPTYVKREKGDSGTVDFFGLPAHVRLDARGNILGLSGRGTTDQVVVTRIPAPTLEPIAARFAARDSAGQPLGQLSPRDTVRATVGSAHLLVDYGRPARRGRTIFGDVVPWDKVWRTGANAATGFTTDRDLVMNGTTIPAGSYTLWTLPARDGAKLIVNKQTGQWGTDYDGSKDLARIDLQRARAAQPVERFTIAIDSTSGNAGVLRLAWADTEWRMPFTVR